ncbi:MAG: DinB family protein [Terriglobales bacterium]
MKIIRCFSLVLLLVATVAAQQSSPDNKSSNPVTDAVRGMIDRNEKNLTAAVNAMPAEKYSYKPTPEQMTFGHLVTHIAEANNFLCAKLSGQAAPKENAKETDPKDKLESEVKASFDYCRSVLKNVNDSQLGESITLFGGHPATKASALIGLASTWADHYGAAAMYLRLNGVLPPTAKKAEPEKK